MRMRTAILAALCALLWTSPALADPGAPAKPQAAVRAEALGLMDCIDLAQANSAQVERSQGMSQWADAEQEAATLRFFPRVDLNLTHQPKVDFFGRPVDYVGPLREGDDVYASELKLTQPVYSPEVARSLDQARQRRKSAELMKEGAGLDVALEVVANYYQVLAARQKSAVGQGLVDQARSLVESTRVAYESGRLLKEDYLEARARLMEVTYHVADSASQAREGAARLRTLLGLPSEARLPLKYQSPGYTPPADIQALVDKATKDSRFLSQAKAEEKLAAATLALAQSRHSGRLNLVGSYGLEGMDFPGDDKFAKLLLTYELELGEFGGSAYYGYEHQYENDVSFYYQDKDLQQRGVNLNWLGKRDSPVVEVAEAKARRFMAHSDLRARRMELARRVIVLQEEARRAGAQLEAAQSAETLLAERVEVIGSKVAAGRATPAEELEGRIDWAKARVKLIEARFARYEALTRLCLITGGDLNLSDRN